jgi:osmoprotectant transport system ATP-binding protein
MIEVRNLCKRFGAIAAVDDLNFKIETGQTLALVGPSGSGKTTTLRMLNRLVEPDAGQILINAEDVTHQPVEQMRRRMGYVIQHTGLFPHYTVAENVAIVPNLLGWETRRVHMRVYELLEQMGLPPETYATRYPDQLSGGQQQRVGLARALAANPPIILMDEPFGALDTVTRRRIRQEVLQMDAFADKTIILITHDVEEAFETADLICLLDQGKVQQIGPPKDLLQKPENDFVTNFFADQKLQLEWMIFTLSDVFEQLPTEPMGQSGMEFSSTTTLRQALRVLSAGTYDVGIITLYNEKRYFDMPTLITAQQLLK